MLQKNGKMLPVLGGLVFVILHSFRLENLWIMPIDKEVAPVAQFTYATGATKKNDVKKWGLVPHQSREFRQYVCGRVYCGSECPALADIFVVVY